MVTQITEAVIITLIIISQILYNFKLFTLIFTFLSFLYYKVGAHRLCNAPHRQPFTHCSFA